MQLPTEIRLRILQDLLFRPEPLAPKLIPCPQCAAAVPNIAVYTHFFKHRAQKNTLGLYTEVLRVCHQLNDEGTPILHANTAAVVARLQVTANADFSSNGRLLFPAISLIFIGHTSYQSANLAHCRVGLRAECPLAKIHLTVRISAEDEILEIFKLFEHLVSTIQHTRLLTNLIFRLEISPGSPKASLKSDAFFRYFSELRGIPHVQVSGLLDKPRATQLAFIMMSPESNA